MTDVQITQEDRDVLARELEREGRLQIADEIRRGECKMGSVGAALRAIASVRGERPSGDAVELQRRLGAAKRRAGDIKAIYTRYREGTDIRSMHDVMDEIEGIAYSIRMYCEGVPGVYLSATPAETAPETRKVEPDRGSLELAVMHLLRREWARCMNENRQIDAELTEQQLKSLGLPLFPGATFTSDTVDGVPTDPARTASPPDPHRAASNFITEELIVAVSSTLHNSSAAKRFTDAVRRWRGMVIDAQTAFDEQMNGDHNDA